MKGHDEPRRFSKQVAIKATDDDEMTATGVVLTPYELDRQLDWLDADGVAAMYNPATADGVMHAAFPDDHAELERSEVLDEAETIDGVEFGAGEWVVRRKYNDEDRWELVKSGVLSAFSIGGDVTNVVEYDSVEDIPDEVDTSAVDPDTVPDRYHPPTKIVNGAVNEISDVDIGAVPSADMAVVKSVGAETTKNILEETSGREEFVDVMRQRGADEDGAELLYDYLEDETDKHKMGNHDTDSPANGAGDHDDFSDVDDATLGKRLKAFLFGDDGSGDPDDGTDDTHVPEVPADAAKAIGAVIAKEGRTLNSQNREALMAAHDAIETALESDLDIETNRFTDDPTTDFDLSQYGEKPDGEKAADTELVTKLTDEQGNLVANALQRFLDAQGDASFSEFRSWLWSTDILDDDTAFAAEEAAWQYEDWVREQRDQAPVTEEFADWIDSETDTDTEITLTMPTDTDDKFADAPDWAKALAERIDDDGDDPGAEKGDDVDADDSDDKPEWAKSLEERVDAIAADKADTQQATGDAEKNGEGEGDALDDFAKLLG